MDWSAWTVAAVVGLSLVGLIIAASRRAWNVDGSDDARRHADARPPDGLDVRGPAVEPPPVDTRPAPADAKEDEEE